MFVYSILTVISKLEDGTVQTHKVFYLKGTTFEIRNTIKTEYTAV